MPGIPRSGWHGQKSTIKLVVRPTTDHHGTAERHHALIRLIGQLVRPRLIICANRSVTLVRVIDLAAAPTHQTCSQVGAQLVSAHLPARAAAWWSVR
jgi:hypothetical protein